MNKTIPSLALVVAAASLAATPVWAATPEAATAAAAKPAAKASDLFADSVVAKGKGVEVKRTLLDEETIRIKAQWASRGQPVPPQHQALLEQQILEQLIQLQLLKAKATDADRAAGKQEAEKRFADAAAKLGSDETVNLRLKAEGLTREELVSKWAENATADAVLKRELKVNISDEEVKKYYDENPARFEQPETVRASHILLSTIDSTTKKELPEDQKAAKRKKMEDVLKRARAGEDFAKLAKEYSDDPGSKDKGGEYTFARGQMVPEFEAAAFSLSPNQISDIVTTQYGYHIIKLSEKIPAKKVELAKVSPELKDYLTMQAIRKGMPAYIEKLKKDAGVEILDPKLKPQETPDASASSAGIPSAGSSAK